MTYTTYTTKEGDRLDAIAFAAYGSLDTVFTETGLDAIGSIMAANNGIAVTLHFEAGIILFMPVFDDGKINNINLPPWLSSN